MTAHIYSSAALGFEGKLIDVECDASNSLPNLLIVGLGNKAIDEARERVRSAIKNSKLDFPRKRVTINLAPASLPKDGSHFDLPIAMAILSVSGQLHQQLLASTLFVGELALDGSLRPVQAIINHIETAKAAGLSHIVMPRGNCQQASLIPGVEIIGLDTLREAYLYANGQLKIDPYTTQGAAIATQHSTRPPHAVQFDDIAGHQQAKRALTIAAAGHHNILLTGPPGAGKTMLARAIMSILPPLCTDEIVEVTKLHSLAGETSEAVVLTRPFRAPHHSASHISLIGGGAQPRPGEISLAHRGVLFLDELPEYNRPSLESLRQPLEDKIIHITRAKSRASYPADFMLVATQNPCPCGYCDDPTHECTCSPAQILHYQKKLSGPLLDRIDIVLTVSSVTHNQLLQEVSNDAKPTIDYAKQVMMARRQQEKRYSGPHKTNSGLNSTDIKQLANLAPDSKQLLDTASKQLQLSARGYFKTIKVARTIADLEASPDINPMHIAEALRYRM